MNEEIIVNVIKELSCNSAAGPDGVPVFDNHIAAVANKCSRLCGCISRTFSTRSKSVLLTLFKSIVIPHLDYGSQLWSPFKVKNINALEKVQRVFTKHIDECNSLNSRSKEKTMTDRSAIMTKLNKRRLNNQK